MTERPDYGIDAPGVVRNLVVAGLAALAVGVAAMRGLLPKVVTIAPTPEMVFSFPLKRMGLSAGLGFLFGAGLMYFSSRYGKTGERNKLLDSIDWRGDERVLDVGCGRGSILVGAALRVPSGSAVGVDIWQAEDLSGNNAEAPLHNAALEGVAERITVQTADMRKLPFPDDQFDVVVSCHAIHNIYSKPERAAAVREIARVLRPGGRAVIMDIRHLGEYRATFAQHGCADVRVLDSGFWSVPIALATFGMVRPNTLLARKAAGSTAGPPTVAPPWTPARTS